MPRKSFVGLDGFPQGSRILAGHFAVATVKQRVKERREPSSIIENKDDPVEIAFEKIKKKQPFVRPKDRRSVGFQLIRQPVASGRKDQSTEGFDPGSERTLAAWIRHASRSEKAPFGGRVKWRKGE